MDEIENECRTCGTPISINDVVCSKCYVNPETNNCSDCGKHLQGISYEYICGEKLYWLAHGITIDKKQCDCIEEDCKHLVKI